MPVRPYSGSEYNEASLYAARAFWEGKASESQQLLVRDWLLHRLCKVDESTHMPGGVDGQRASDFAEGKRWVGVQLRWMQTQEATHEMQKVKSGAKAMAEYKAQPLSKRIIRGKRQEAT